MAGCQNSVDEAPDLPEITGGKPPCEPDARLSERLPVFRPDFPSLFRMRLPQVLGRPVASTFIQNQSIRLNAIFFTEEMKPQSGPEVFHIPLKGLVHVQFLPGVISLSCFGETSKG